jgi:GNAT superfamily N-acetyltransferase
MNTGVEARNYRALAVLLDGSTIHIRAIRPHDRGRLLAHFRGLSTQSVLLRFHGAKRSLSEAELTHLTDLDFINHVGLVATFSEELEQPLIGVGRYIMSEHDPECAEVGFAILDAHQGKGIGSALLHHLAIIGIAAGIKEFDADVLVSNYQMSEVLEHSGFKLKCTEQLGVSRQRLTIA